MSNIETLDLIYSFAVLMAFIPGLWIAGRFLLRLLAGRADQENNWIFNHHAALLVAWLALGALFTRPFIDLLGVLLGLSSVFVAQPGAEATTSWGSAPWSVYTLLVGLLTTLTYVFVFWTGQRFLVEAKLPDMVHLELSRTDRDLLLLGVGGLVNFVVHDFVVQVIWLRLPAASGWGLPGFAAAWLLALLVLAGALVWMEGRLTRLEPE